MPSDVEDVRALSVNPAGLGVYPEASVYFDLTVGDPGAEGQLRQLNAGFNSHGLAFGYQRDEFGGGVTGSTFRIGIGAGSHHVSAGLGAAIYRGNTKGTGWNLGTVYTASPSLTIAGVIENIGQPRVRGLTQRISYTASATFFPVSSIALGALAAANTSGMTGYAFSARASLGAHPLFGLLARFDTDQDLRRTGFSFGLSIGGADRLGLAATTPGTLSSIDNLTLYGVSSRLPQTSRH